MSSTFFAKGIPAPQGSKAYKGHRNGKPVLVESSKKVKPWREAVAAAAKRNFREPLEGAVIVDLIFLMPRPKSLPKKVQHHVKRPDADKLTRSTMDALTDIAFEDDSRVVDFRARKQYAEPGQPTGAIITVVKARED